MDGVIALSFLELMELRVIKVLVDCGVSLQYVRRAALVASEQFGTDHPFASRRIFTDGRAIFSALSSEEHGPDVVVLEPRKVNQVISGRVFEQFLEEIEFNARTSLAFRWWPKGRSQPIVLDPKVCFGAPVVEGTAVRTSTLAEMAGHTSAKDAAVAYAVELKQAEAAVAFEGEMAAA